MVHLDRPRYDQPSPWGLVESAGVRWLHRRSRPAMPRKGGPLTTGDAEREGWVCIRAPEVPSNRVRIVARRVSARLGDWTCCCPTPCNGIPLRNGVTLGRPFPGDSPGSNTSDSFVPFERHRSLASWLPGPVGARRTGAVSHEVADLAPSA